MEEAANVHCVERSQSCKASAIHPCIGLVVVAPSLVALTDHVAHKAEATCRRNICGEATWVDAP